MIDLDKLLELEAKATKSPWLWEHNDCYITGPQIDDLDYQGPIILGSADIHRKENAHLIEAMRNSIKELCLELRAARRVVESVKWMADTEERHHGEDCDYWDNEAEKPSGEECECGIIATKNALKKLDEARRE